MRGTLPAGTDSLTDVWSVTFRIVRQLLRSSEPSSLGPMPSITASNRQARTRTTAPTATKAPVAKPRRPTTMRTSATAMAMLRRIGRSYGTQDRPTAVRYLCDEAHRDDRAAAGGPRGRLLARGRFADRRWDRPDADPRRRDRDDRRP